MTADLPEDVGALVARLTARESWGGRKVSITDVDQAAAALTALSAETAALRADKARLEGRVAELERAKPLTKADLHNALGWFWNASLSATHPHNDPTANAVMSGMVEGLAAVAYALAPPPQERSDG